MKLRVLMVLLPVMLLFGCVAQGKKATLQFHSFDGGGPSFTLRLADEELVSVAQTIRYNKANHKQMTGAGYDVIFTFRGLRAGETTMTVEQRSPMGDDADYLYRVTVDDSLAVTVEKLGEERVDRLAERTATLVIESGGTVHYAPITPTDGAEALLEKLSEGPLTVVLTDGDAEKWVALPWNLPDAGTEVEAYPGDWILLDGNRLAFCYTEAVYRGTSLGRIDGSWEPVFGALGGGDRAAVLWLEWDE